jgi:hypothetical protein
VKVLFRLERDSRGWPPVDIEGMWAKKVGDNQYVLDNTPFYARGIAIGDVVSTVAIDGDLYFRKVLREGGHGTIRILLKNEAQLEALAARLESFRCEFEVAPPRLVAVDVLPETAVAALLEYLAAEQAASRLGYEEGCKSW